MTAYPAGPRMGTRLGSYTMTDTEEHLMGLAEELARGLDDMIRAGRLTEADIPDDFAWLKGKVEETIKTAARVEAEDDL